LYRRAFDEDFPICWFLYEETTGRCRVQAYLDGRPAHERDKVIARMKEWARNGNWNTRVGFVKQLTLPPKFSDVVIYEVKSHQDRILFVRCHRDAVAIDGMQKKNDWSKKDNHVLEAAVLIARAVMQECGERGERR
jgi:hypothetical protein